MYYRVGQNESTVEAVIDVHVYDCDNLVKPFTLTSDSSELTMSDCGDDCTDLFEAGIYLTYRPTGAQASTAGNHEFYLRATLNENSTLTWQIPVLVEIRCDFVDDATCVH